ncbi:MAG TPA: DUF928 domain-containing protein [Methylomirabilota bacterium]|nr:DUF928 domain-containing protein [Methylomirabilota bacterium]
MKTTAVLTLSVWVVAGPLDLGLVGIPAPVTPLSAQPTTASQPVYKPPRRGAPGGRVGGATRGHGAGTTTVAVLVPDHTGLTVQEQPTLYWFLSTPTTLPIEVTLIEANAVRPMLETRLPAPERPGVQRISLADHGVRLVPGSTYKWYVALVVDPNYRSKDILAGGLIERVEQSAVRLEAMPGDPLTAPRIFADAGVWYDAIASISALIEHSPGDPLLRSQRAALLEQVGLREIAEFDRRPGRQQGVR